MALHRAFDRALMMNTRTPRKLPTGGEILVDTLVTHGAAHVFCVPGESFLPVLDALHDAPLPLTVCRQEGAAAMMAEAYGKLTGEPGICFVTRAPGATNASAGVHIAQQDSTPMILFVGQVARGMREREAFQEIDYRRMYAPLAKWVAEIDDPARIPEFVTRAYRTATSGRPGPVVLALPEDVLGATASPMPVDRYRRVEAHPGEADMERLRAILAAAQKPFVLVGGGGWSEAACADLRRFAELWRLPVGVSFRCQDYFDNDHPNYAGDVGIGVDPKLWQRIQSADVLLVLGARLGEMTTGGYKLLEVPKPRTTLIHAHPGAEEIGRVYQPALGINAAMGPMTHALARLKPPKEPGWAEETARAHDDYRRWTEPPEIPGEVQLGQIMDWLGSRLPADAILTNGAGNYSSWPNRFYRFRRYRTLLGPTSGSMGYGLPAAVAAKRLYPKRTVIAFAGDGCFLMTGQEFATACQYGLAIVVIVVNNAMYGTIRMHQERAYPGRVSGTALENPDFAALARAFGGHGETVARTAEFAPAFERAVASGRPALIELRIDPEAITPSTTLNEIREKAIAGKQQST